VGLGMSAISLGTWLIAADWLRRKLPAPDSEFYLFSPEFMIRALVEPVWITFMVNLLFLGYALPRLRARFGPGGVVTPRRPARACVAMKAPVTRAHQA